ncbi:MAG TPA: hypothetical protein VFE85_05165, partial [Woeseiaceae bacterium]|nr:hypothetical protein [Woeseiaceae bacterium]
MSGLIRLAIVTCLLAVPVGAGHAQELDAARLAGIVERGMAMWQVPGMAVAVLDGDEIVLERGFGRTAADGAAVDTHTL